MIGVAKPVLLQKRAMHDAGRRIYLVIGPVMRPSGLRALKLPAHVAFPDLGSAQRPAKLSDAQVTFDYFAFRRRVPSSREVPVVRVT